MQWKGPYKIKEKINSMNYRVDMGRRSQVFHANLLKHYYRRTEIGHNAILQQEPALEIAAIAVIEDSMEDALENNDTCSYHQLARLRV